MNIIAETDKVLEYAEQHRRFLHAHPEASLQEASTGRYLRTALDELGISWNAAARDGVTADIGHNHPILVLRADMDALNITEETGLDYHSINEGVFHACGHDFHMASLLGCAKILKEHEADIPGTIRLLFQPAEENCAGAVQVVDEGWLDDVDAVFGSHVFSDIPLGTVSADPGPRMAGADIFHIHIKGKSGHAGKPHLAVDALVCAAAVINTLQTAVSRNHNPCEGAVLTIGKLTAGTAFNIVADSADMDGTIRYFSDKEGDNLRIDMRRIVENTAAAFGALGEVSFLEQPVPPVINNVQLSETARNAFLRAFSAECVQEESQMMIAEDFAFYRSKAPSCFAFIGAGNSEKGEVYPNHHCRFNPDELTLKNQIMATLCFVNEYFCMK